MSWLFGMLLRRIDSWSPPASYWYCCSAHRSAVEQNDDDDDSNDEYNFRDKCDFHHSHRYIYSVLNFIATTDTTTTATSKVLSGEMSSITVSLFQLRLPPPAKRRVSSRIGESESVSDLLFDLEQQQHQRVPHRRQVPRQQWPRLRSRHRHRPRRPQRQRPQLPPRHQRRRQVSSISFMTSQREFLTDIDDTSSSDNSTQYNK